MTWKIIADSGCDYRQLPTPAINTTFVSVPLTIQVADQVFVDDASLDIDQMMETMYATAEASKSACPSPDDYLRAFEGAKNIFLVTITGTLSGSHNSAQLAKNIYLEDHPDTKIHVIDSLSAGGEVDLLVEKLNDLIDQGLSFEEVVEAITAYQEKTKLLFVLAKVDNLVKNGRLSKLIGTVVGLLNIRMVGKASEAGYAGGRIVMAQRNNEKCCQQLSERIRETFPQADIKILPTSGLCSFYAEEGGLLMGYEID